MKLPASMIYNTFLSVISTVNFVSQIIELPYFSTSRCQDVQFLQPAAADLFSVFCGAVYTSTDGATVSDLLRSDKATKT